MVKESELTEVKRRLEQPSSSSLLPDAALASSASTSALAEKEASIIALKTEVSNVTEELRAAKASIVQNREALSSKDAEAAKCTEDLRKAEQGTI